LGRHVEITFKEERLLKELEKKIKQGYANPVPAVADELRLAVHTVYTTLGRIRDRYRASLKFGSEYRSWRKKLGKYL
jgi:hypothetical protein